VLVSQLSEQFKTRREELPERIASIVTRLRDAERDLQRAQSDRLLGNAAELAQGAADAGGAAYVAYQVPDGTPADGIRKVALDVRGRLSSERPGVVVVAGVPADRPTVVVTVNEAGRARGLKAGSLVLTATGVLGGRGGGKDDVAQGGGAPLGDRAATVIVESFSVVRSAIADIMETGGVL
jgi:alanyl-tRNA synthetase